MIDEPKLVSRYLFGYPKSILFYLVDLLRFKFMKNFNFKNGLEMLKIKAKSLSSIFKTEMRLSIIRYGYYLRELLQFCLHLQLASF
ncbi:hypothetical protein BANRA_03121 [Klebsiella pneumoniae]|nr:hypothetical protein BANRA_03121 [Klebsiella pneumoniae]